MIRCSISQTIKKQLDLTYADAADEFSEICSLNNPTVKRKLLLDFADECDSAAVHLKAAALPRQSTQVILPLNAMKETEIFAPNYRDGEKVVLIRYPHGGTFEIPELTVNNKNPTAVSVLGKNIRDAVGINPKVAERLSGADFDGDQVVVIPTGGRVKIQSTPALKDLKDFDPKTDYSTEGKTGVRLLAKGAATQRQMGEISNLITDMTLKGATEPEIARAVKHSMVVIDAAKHKLDYRQSEKDNGIAELKKKYQGFDDETGHHGGASTLLSRRKQDVEVPERQGSGVIDPLTGKVVYKESGRTYVDPRTGKTVAATTKVKRILAVDDVRSMSSGTLQEEAYADYANKMKDLANKARLEYKATPTLKRSASAAKAFEPEVNRLMAALKVAQLNAPLEREAQRIANARVKAKVQANNITDKDEISKIRRAAISDARNSTGASGKRTRITISDGEWTAIQSGAISDTTLSEILRYPEMWMKANPNIGKTVSYETYQLDVERAEKAPAARNDILAKRFGLPMEGYTYYFTYEETLPHRKRDYWQMACALGGDLSQGDDFCSFTFLFPLRNGSFGVKTRNYITSRTLNKLPAAMRNKYEQFMDEGSLVVLDGTVLDPMQVYEDLDEYIVACGYDVRCFGYDPYNAKEFVERWAAENGPFGIEKVIQGAKTESVPLGELKKLAEDRMLLFDEELMTYAMGNCIAMEDTNGNRKLMKKRYEQKIDAVSAMMDAYIAYKRNPEAFE